MPANMLARKFTSRFQRQISQYFQRRSAVGAAVGGITDIGGHYERGPEMFKFLLLFLAIAGHLAGPAAATEQQPRNIVLIYADDLGFGDVACNGGAIATPNIDRLAREGLRFTDAHSSAATCTPSRFALLTGQYAFRQRGTGVLPGDAPLIIADEAVTLPELLQAVGYETAVVGKWHLGLGREPVDWNGEIKPGPEQIGFGYHFLIPATGDRVPCVYVEQNRVVGAAPDDPIAVSYNARIDQTPSGKERPDALKQRWSHGHDQTIVNGISRIGWMTGGERARWIDEDMADVTTGKAIEFIDRAVERKSPFFLFFSTHDIHVPRVPHTRFEGVSGQGLRGDATVQLDWSVGEILAALDKHGVTEDTLVIFTSDNGPVLDDGYRDQANELVGDHDANGPYRAGKYSLYEGGTRVPFIVRWPARVKGGETSDALFGQVDLAASLAAVVESPLEPGDCPDSRDESDALLGKDPIGRPHLVQEAGRLALRMGQWKFIPPGRVRDSLNPGAPREVAMPGELYNLADDPSESNDLSSQEDERVEEMAKTLSHIRAKADGDPRKPGISDLILPIK
jgi:arylsulfatase A-like enzyme